MRLVVVALLALVACTDDRVAVSGKYITRYYTAYGPVDHAPDASAFGFQVLSNGAWYPPSGPVEGTFDGTFYIADVPPGGYTLRVVTPRGMSSWRHYETHDFTSIGSRVGRPDAQPTANAPLHLQLQGLATWNDGDYFLANCWENGTEHYLSPSLAVGATSMDMTFNWGEPDDYGAYLMDATAGDTLTISRVGREDRGDLSVSRVTQVASGPAESQREGETSTFAGTFVDVPLTIAQTLTVAAQDFAAQLPPGLSGGWGVSLLKSPGSLAFNWFGPPLISVSRLYETSPMPSVTQMFGDPFDSSWQLVAAAGYGGAARIALPSGASTMMGSAYHSYETRYVDGPDFFFAPTNLLVEAGTLDGHALAGDVPWDGASPLSLHVDVPADNRGFSADVYRLRPNALQVDIENWTHLESETSDIELPADALAAGEYFLLRVHVGKQTATSQSGAFSILGPFRLVVQ